MHPLLGLLGAVLVVTALVDMLWTTVAVSAGGGPVTSMVARRVWWTLGSASRGSERRHRWLRFAGVLVVVSVFSVWIGAVVVGWTLIFASSPGAVLTASTAEPVGWTGRLYYAGFVTSTLGVGDLVAGDGLWRLLTVAAAFTGLSVATMSISYLVPVASAVVNRRTLSLEISGLGATPADILVASWEGGRGAVLERKLGTLSSSVTVLGQHHLSYPVLHHFHDVERRASAPVNITVLDEALTLLRFGVPHGQLLHPMELDGARTAIAAFLSTVSPGHVVAAREAPPLPSLAPLREAGIPTVSDEEFAAALRAEDGEDMDRRRRLLRGYLEDHGWDWSAVAPADREGGGVAAVDPRHLREEATDHGAV